MAGASAALTCSKEPNFPRFSFGGEGFEAELEDFVVDETGVGEDVERGYSTTTWPTIVAWMLQ